MAQHGRDVGCDEELLIAHPNDDRRPVAHGHDLVGVARGNQHESEQPAQLRERTAHGVFQPVKAHLALDEMRDHLRVGLGFEPMPFLFELVLEVEVVLDDAVVDDDDLTGAIAVRVRVLFRRASVCRPAGMPNTVAAADRLGPDDFFEPGQFPRAPSDLHLALLNERDSGRIIAAILESSEPVHQDRDDLFGADVTNDAAHDQG